MPASLVEAGDGVPASLVEAGGGVPASLVEAGEGVPATLVEAGGGVPASLCSRLAAVQTLAEDLESVWGGGSFNTVTENMWVSLCTSKGVG